MENIDIIDKVSEILINNGFKKFNNTLYTSTKCNVYIGKKSIMIYNKAANTNMNYDYNIYWLIGVLVYNGLLDKPFVRLSGD